MGRRGPQPKPAALLGLSGHWRGKERAKEELKVETCAPEPPAWLDKEAKEEWARVIPSLLKVGIVAKQDRALLTIYCQAWSEYVAAQKALKKHEKRGTKYFGDLVDHPRKRMQEAATQLIQTADRFGMSASTRARLGKENGDGKGKGNHSANPAAQGKERFFGNGGPALKLA